MSITRYIAEAGLAADTPAVALQRLRNRRIVNRYDGSTVTDNASSITGVGTDDNIVLNSAVTIPTGYNVFIDKTVIIQDTFNTNTNGSHLSFFNCNIIVETAGGNPGPLAVTTGQLNNTAVPSGVATGQAAGRSLNFYGCSLLINPAFSNFFQMFSDFMDSNMTFTQPTGAGGIGVNIPLPSFVVGSRVINGTFYGTAKNANAVMEIYGIPDIVEGLDIFRMSLEYTGQAGEGSLMFVEPNFSSPELQRRWRSQTPGADTLMQSIGFYTPADNTSANNVTTDNSFPAYFRATNAAGGQLLNYYAWRPSFFSDVTLTTPIPGVRVRGGSNIVINAAGQALNAPESNISAAITNTGVIDLTGAAISVVNEFVTDASGVPVADANSSVSFNGGTSFTDGQWFDWLRLGSANVASATTAGNSLGTNFSGQDSPDNVIFAPVARFDFNNFNQYAATYEARSYTHEVSSGVLRQNGRIGTDAGQQAANVPVAIADATTVAAAVSYVDNTEAQALAGFDATGSKTASAVAQFIRAGWSTYETDREPTGTSSSVTWAGAVTFDSTNTNSSVSGGAAVLSRIDELVAGDVNAIAANSFVIATDITGVDLTATGNMNLGVGNTITGSTLTATSFTNFPTTLDGSITFVGTYTVTASGTLNVTDVNAVDGLNLVVNAGVTLNVTGAVEADFASVTGAGTVNYLFSTTITADVSNGIITIRKADGTYLNYPNVNSQIISSADLPGGTHRAIVTAKGRSAVPVEIVVDGSTDFALTSTDLGPLGYSPLVDIGTTRTYARVTFDSRQVVRTTETGKNNYYTNPLESARWFGDLYGEQATNEVILDNFALTGSSEMFTLTPSNNVATINLPLVQAYHGTGVTGVLTFSANDALAKGVDADYEMTDGFTANITATAGQGVNSVPNTVGGLSGTITTEIDRSIDVIITNTDAEISIVDAKVDDMWRNRLLGIKPQPSRDS